MSELAVIRCGDIERTQAECLDRAGRLATALHSSIAQADRVALLARNSVDFLEISLAIASNGGNPVPINYHWTATEIATLLSDCRPVALFCDPDLRDLATAAIEQAALQLRVVVIAGPELADSHEALLATADAPLPYQDGALPASMGLIYTSGTTGRPKGVMREQMTGHQLLSVAGSTATRMGIRDGGSVLIAGPLYHTSPNAIALLGLRMGANITIMRYFDAEHFLQLVERDRVEHAKVVPTMLSRLLSLNEETRRKYDVSSLTHLVHSAAPCPPAVKQAAIEWFGNAVQEFYGCTEGGTITWITADEWLAKPGSVGQPIDGSAVEIHKDDGTVAAPNEIGHVVVTAPSYWPQFHYLNAADDGPSFPLDVGDTGYIDEDGYLFLTGRSAEIVNIGGVNVYPAELEAAAMGLPGIEDAAAVGRSSSSDLGEELVLYVVPRPGASVAGDDVLDGLRAVLAPYKLPKTVVVRPTLPRDDNGKVYKRKLSGVSAASSTPQT
jgi:long-chain acyl-CoA synthetase